MIKSTHFNDAKVFFRKLSAVLLAAIISFSGMCINVKAEESYTLLGGWDMWPDDYTWKTFTGTIIALAGDSLDSKYVDIHDSQLIKSISFYPNGSSPDHVTLSDFPSTAVDNKHLGTIKAYWDSTTGNIYVASAGEIVFDSCGTDEFAGFTNMTNLDLRGLSGNLGDMTYMFFADTSLTTLDLSGFDPFDVRSIEGAFAKCYNLKTINFGNSITGEHLSQISEAFSQCRSLTTLDLSFLKAPNMQYMRKTFEGCTNLEYLDISNIDCSDLKNSFETFNETPKLSTIKSSFNVKSNCDLYNRPLYDFGNIANPSDTSNIALTAMPQNSSYSHLLTLKNTMTFDGNGGESPETWNVRVGAEISLPSSVRAGYQMAGWYTDPVAGDKVGNPGDAFTPAQDIKLYARWDKLNSISYTWTEETPDIVKNNELPEDTASYIKGAAYALTGITYPPVKDEEHHGQWVFAGWNDPNQGVMGSSNITITGNWTFVPETYAVAFKNYDGTVISSKNDYQYGDATVIPDVPTRTEDTRYTYIFAGWDVPVAQLVTTDATYTAMYNRQLKSTTPVTTAGEQTKVQTNRPLTPTTDLGTSGSVEELQTVKENKPMEARPSTPNTGDQTNIPAAVGVLLVSLLAMSAVSITKKRFTRN